MHSCVNILIVEDNPHMRRLLVGLVRSVLRPNRVLEAADGRRALSLCRNARPKVVVMDVRLPGASGIELTAEIKSVLPESVVVIVSTTGNARDREAARAAGASAYVLKDEVYMALPTALLNALGKERASADAAPSPRRGARVKRFVDKVTTTVASDIRQAGKTLSQTVKGRRDRERLRNDLVDMLVHDMRSQLTVLIANLQLVKMEAMGEMADHIEQAIRGGMNLSQLVTTVLDVRRLEEGKMPTTLVKTDAADLAREVATSMVALEPERAIEVSAAGDTTCVCDIDLIRRVLENLVSNAIKHTPRAGGVHVAVTREPSAVRIAVQDEGAGIPPEARKRLFDKFGAVAVRKDHSYHSVGLGLAFCKLAVEAHGGTITVEDGTPRGSVFIVELPC
jgi:two-component system, sensor histidine kinase and response regulator